MPPPSPCAQVLLSPEGVLTVQGEKRQEEGVPPGPGGEAEAGKEAGKEQGTAAAGRGYSRRYAAFKRSVLLPGDVDEEGINASVKNGVLTISVPKVAAREAAKPREIPVKTA